MWQHCDGVGDDDLKSTCSAQHRIIIALGLGLGPTPTVQKVVDGECLSHKNVTDFFAA
jgi:hypothetical protein